MPKDGNETTLLLMGRIGAAHGVRGDVRIQSFTEDPLALAGYGPLSTNRPGLVIEIASARGVLNNGIVARLKGVGSREAAERLNGVELYVDRALLPQPDDEDDFYHADLIGLTAQLEDGTVIGKVAAVPNFGAGDILDVRASNGAESFLFPFTRAVVPQINVAAGYLVIVPPTDADPGEEEPG